MPKIWSETGSLVSIEHTATVLAALRVQVSEWRFDDDTTVEQSKRFGLIADLLEVSAALLRENIDEFERELVEAQKKKKGKKKALHVKRARIPANARGGARG